MSTVLPIEQLYTVVPESKQLFEKTMFDGLPKLPEHSRMTAYGIEKVDFPIYLADPSALLPNGFIAMKLDDAMDEMKYHAYQWLDKGEKRTPNMLPEGFHDLPMQSRAKAMATFMEAYKEEKSMPSYLNFVLSNTLKFPENDMSERLFRVAMLAELASQSGDKLKEEYLDVVTFKTDLSNTNSYLIPAELDWAGNNKPRLKSAIKTILEHQHDGSKMDHEQVAELGCGLVEFGLSRKELSKISATAFEMGGNEPPELKQKRDEKSSLPFNLPRY